MKNENGSGTVYKLKGKRRKPWVARVTTGYSLEGKQLRKTIGTFATKREAQEHLLKYNKNPLLFNKITFGEVKEMWWAEHKKKIKASSIKDFETHFKKLESLFDIPIADINLMTLQKICDENKAKKPTKSILNMIFNYAVKYDFISANKCNFIEIKPAEKPVSRKIFTDAEIRELWCRVQTTNETEQKTVALTLILIYSGMRVGEFLNLRNEDVDLNNCVIHIKESKTRSGIRSIPLNTKIKDLFKLFECENYIYNKKYITIYKNFNKYIHNHTIHDTRHTFASLLNNANANKTSIIKLIGHSDFSITENVYTHKDMEELRKAVDLIQ